jgi:cytidylate kinase
VDHDISQKKIIICIDGPAASGKGTVALKVADCLGFSYFSTGYVYRYLAHLAMIQNISLSNASCLVDLATSLHVIDLENILPELLYQTDISQASSIIAEHSKIREALIALQRRYVYHCSAPGVIVDGRDTGSVLFPNADYKFFLTATLAARAARRFKQLQSQYKNIIYSEVLNELQERDLRDTNRQVAPLVQAEGAVLIDSTFFNQDQVVVLIVRKIKGLDIK